MFFIDILPVCRGQERPIVIQRELHKGGREGPVEYEDVVVGRALVLPRPPGRVTSVALELGPGRLTHYAVEHRPLDPNVQSHGVCHVDGETLTLNPCPMFPDANLRVEFDDGG